MKQQKKQQKNDKFELRFLPLVLILAVIPLFTFAHMYTNHLDQYAWYSTNTASYDFFLFWKARAIAITGILAVAVFLYYIVKKKQDNPFKKQPLLWVPLGIYLLLALVSSFVAMDKIFAFLGGAEQFEGFFVLLTYGIMVCYAYYFVREEKDVHIIYQVLMVGVGLLSLIGALQFAGADFYQSDLGQALITMLEPNLWGKKLTFNFGKGRSYATLYNPNYVGSYVALLLPVILSGIVIFKKKWEKVIMGALAVFLLLSLMGSESMTGYLALFASVILFVIMMIPFFHKHWKKVLVAAAGVVVVCAILVVVKKDAVEYGINKIFHYEHNDYEITKVANSDKGLAVTTKNGMLYVDFSMENDKVNLSLMDDKGAQVAAQQPSEEATSVITDQRFYGIVLSIRTYKVGSESRVGFSLGKSGKSWNFVKANDKYYFYNVFNRVDRIYDVASMGFETTQHFASRRGYIWSRTLPLLQDNLLWGCGPDNFILNFPNNDYIGLTNNNYQGQIVTKPHNMYLQIAMQTGVLSLIAFFAFYFIYFVQSVRIYYRTKQYGFMEKAGLGILIGTFGYMVTGIANDSTVTVAPIFWTLMGVGLAINRKVKGKR